jgi:hypothetical protein
VAGGAVVAGVVVTVDRGGDVVAVVAGAVVVVATDVDVDIVVEVDVDVVGRAVEVVVPAARAP